MRWLTYMITLSACLTLSACALRWSPATTDFEPARESQSAQILLERAEECFDKAATEVEITTCLDLYKDVLETNPGSYSALTRSSTLHILLGTAYTDNPFRKSDHFQLAMKYAELAMYTNQDFYQRVSEGETLWEASDALSADEVEAMFFWVTALQYEFKEGMSLPSKIVNVGWLKHALVMLERIKEVDPDFGGGGVEFAKVICYYALPGAMGGSKEIGDTLMQQSVDKSDDWLLPRWARGKYYYEINGNRSGKQQDLEWVANQPLDDFKDPYPWRIHFQENARELARLD